MEELSWYVGARITRDRHGNVHWFVESSDGLSHGHLVDEGTPTTLMAAILCSRREVFAELVRLAAIAPEVLAPFARPPIQ
jgi:hypothetical protein